MRVSKKDLKLFREKVGSWQERYMEKLVGEYIKMLSGDDKASTKFWNLEKRIKNDRRSKGVIISLSRSDVIVDLCEMLNEKIITFDDLEDFSDELKDTLLTIQTINQNLYDNNEESEG